VSTALRDANITVELIPGDEEARLITKGVLAALPPLEERVLIMDIGGGSTEFIIADGSGVHWRQSFPLGVSVLYNNFHRGDPIQPEAVRELETFLATETAPLAAALTAFPTHHLAGAAGTFDVLAEVLRHPEVPSQAHSHPLTLDGLDALTDQIIGATLQERLAMEGIPEQRADMIVVAMVLIRFVLQLAGINSTSCRDIFLSDGLA